MFDKNVIILSLQAALINKLDIQKNILASIINDRNSETKSSAGDKFETNREMIHIEISKIEHEIFKTEQFINETRTGRSQLIITNNGIFLLLIPFGNLIVNDKEIICISNSAPIARSLLMTRVNSNFEHGKILYKVLEVI